MLNIRRFLSVAVLLGAVSLLMACGLFDFVKQAQELAPSAEAFASQIAPTVQAQITTMPLQQVQDNGESSQGGDVSSPDAWVLPTESNLRSFHKYESMVVVLPNQGKQYRVYEVESDYVQGQGAREIVKENGQVVYQSITVGKRVWIGSNGAWVAITEDAAPNDPADTLSVFIPASAWGGEWKPQGTMSVEGLTAQRFVMDSTISSWSLLGDALVGELQSVPELQGISHFRVQRSQGEVLVLSDGTMIKADYRLQGEAEKDGQKIPTIIEFHMALSNINMDIQITPPPEVAGASAQNKLIPLPEGAQLQMQTDNASMYRVPEPIAQVMQFFDQALPQQGYQVLSKNGSDTTGWLLEVKTPQGVTYTVVIQQGDDGTTNVMITH